MSKKIIEEIEEIHLRVVLRGTKKDNERKKKQLRLATFYAMCSVHDQGYSVGAYDADGTQVSNYSTRVSLDEEDAS